MKHISHLPNPLVRHHLAPQQHGTPPMQHGHVTPPRPLDVVPEQGGPLLRGRKHTKTREGDVSTLSDIREIEHERGHPVPSVVTGWSGGLYGSCYEVWVFVHK